MYQYIKDHIHPLLSPSNPDEMKPVVVMLNGWDELKDQFQAESLWCENIDNRRLKVLNIPFYIYGISLEDMVEVEWKNNELYFKLVDERSGNSTIRILFKSLEDADKILNSLRTLGCQTERDTNSYFAVSIPSATSYVHVTELLDSSGGDLEYEEANKVHV